jgi:hypothetical protein
MGHRIYSGGGPADVRERSVNMSVGRADAKKQPTHAEVVAALKAEIATTRAAANALPSGPERERLMALGDRAIDGLRDYRNIYNYWDKA